MQPNLSMDTESHSNRIHEMNSHNSGEHERAWASLATHAPLPVHSPGVDAAGESLARALQRTHISRTSSSHSQTNNTHEDRSRALHAGSVAAACASVASAVASGASSSLPSPSFASTHVGSDSEASSVAYAHSPRRFWQVAHNSSLSPQTLPPPSVDAAGHPDALAVRSVSPTRIRPFAERSGEHAHAAMETAVAAAAATAELLPSFAAPASSPAIYRPSKSRRLTLPGRSAAPDGDESRVRTPDNACADEDDSSSLITDSLDPSCPAGDDLRAAVRSAFFAPAASSADAHSVHAASSAAAASSSSSAVESSPSSVARSVSRRSVMSLPFFAQIRATILGFAGEDAASHVMDIPPQPPARQTSRGGTGSAPHTGVKLRTRTIRTPTKDIARGGASASAFADDHAAANLSVSALPLALHASPLPLLVLTRPKRRRTADDLEATAAADDAASSAPFVPYLSGLPSLIAPFSPRSSVVPFDSSDSSSAADAPTRAPRVVLRYRVRATSPLQGRGSASKLQVSQDSLSSDSMHTCSPPSQPRRAPHSAPAAAFAGSSSVSPSLFPAPYASLFPSLPAATTPASSAQDAWRAPATTSTAAAATTHAAAAESRSLSVNAAPALQVLQQQAQFWRGEQ